MYALRACNVSGEINMLSVLSAITEANCPLSHVLTNGASGGALSAQSLLPMPASFQDNKRQINFDEPVVPKGGPIAYEPDPFTLSITTPEMGAVCDQVCTEFTLNADQVLGFVDSLAAW